MLRFLAARIAMLVAALATAALVIFLVLEILPGDPAAAMLGVSATPETIAALRAELGLDQPAARRFLRWLAGLVTGDLGLSYAYRVPVGGLIGERFGVTLPLAVLAMLLAAGIGIPLGVAAASRANTRLDAVLMGVSQLGLAIPNFWFGLLFVLIFSIGLGWFPSGGFPGWSAGPGT
ncbi:MAG: ABC transporter permease, partial [Rhabdaerophilum calidifontis]